MLPVNGQEYTDFDYGKEDWTSRTFEGVVFRGCDFRGTTMRYADFKGCTFLRCNMTGVKAQGTKFQDCTFDECDFERADFRETDFTGAQILGCFWHHAVFQNSKFVDNIITGTLGLDKAWIYPLESDGKYFKVIDAKPFGAVITKRTMMLGCLHKTQAEWFAMSSIELAENTCGDVQANPAWVKWKGPLAAKLPEWTAELEDME